MLRTSEAASINCALSEFDAKSLLKKIEHGTTQDLYLIYRETLNNVYKTCRRIICKNIYLVAEPANFILIVQDNRKGLIVRQTGQKKRN